jgi:nitroreductase
MEFFELIQRVERTKKFLHARVEFDKLTAMLEAGNYAISAGSLQNWNLILIEDPDIIRKLATYCPSQGYLAKAPSVIVICGELDLIKQRFGQVGSLYTIQNCAFVANQISLAATDIGVAFNYIFSFQESGVKDLLDIPKTARPELIIPVGYSEEILGFEKRQLSRELNEVVFFDKYGDTKKDKHKIMNQYSIEWQLQLSRKKPQIENFKTRMNLGFDTLKHHAKQAGRKVSEQISKTKSRLDRKNE